jgi:sugar lactone lactonase YvrE
MQNVEELVRQPAPAAKPQPLAFYRGKLWVGCWDNHKIYGIEPNDWDVTDEVEAPGRPYGIAAHGDGLRVVVALEDDDRYLFRFDPGRGFDASSKVACPDVTGSHLASDGTTLYLCQQGKRRILALSERGEATREIQLPTRCAGFAFGSTGGAYMIAADEDFDNLEFARFDITQSAPKVTPLATISPEARGLAFDGSSWWTSLREENEIFGFSAQP